MTVSQTLDFYQQQATALSVIDGAVQQVTTVIERMEDVLTRVVVRMEELLAATRKTSDVASKVKMPFDTAVKDISSGIGKGKGLDSFKQAFNPQGLALSFAINLAWNLFGDDILTILSPAMKVLESFAGMVHEILGAMAPFFGPVVWAAGLLANMLGFLADNAAVLAPLVLGVGAALAIVNGYMAISALMTTLKAGADLASAGAAGTAEKATKGFNAALNANPMLRVITIVIGLVSAFYAIIGALNKVTGETQSATGIIGGLFMGLAAFIANRFIIPVLRMGAIVINFFRNLFNDPAAAIKIALYDLAMTGLGFIRSLVSGFEAFLNLLPGVNVDFSSNLDEVYKGLEAASQATKDESGWVQLAPQLDYIDSAGAVNAGYQFGEGIDKKLAEMANGGQAQGAADDVPTLSSGYTMPESLTLPEGYTMPESLALPEGYTMPESLTLPDGYGSYTAPQNYGAYTPMTSDLVNPAAPLAVETVTLVEELGGIRDEVKLAEEDMQVIQAAAEVEPVVQYITLTPTVVMNARISERVDIDEVMNVMTRKLEGQIDIMAERSYSL